MNAGKAKVTLEDVLAVFVAEANAPSTMGYQLEAAMAAAPADGKPLPPADPFGMTCKPAAGPSAADRDFEGMTLRDVHVARVTHGISKLHKLKPDTLEVPLLEEMTKARRSMGWLVTKTLRTFHSSLGALSEEDIERACKRADLKVRVRPKTACPLVGCDLEGCDSCRWEAAYKRACEEYRAPRALEAVRVALKLPDTGVAAELVADCTIVASAYIDEVNGGLRG